MDEKDLALLAELGYTVNEIGAIVDSHGNYKSEVEYEGHTISSHADIDQFSEYTDKQTSLKSAGFNYDTDSKAPKSVQEDVFLAKKNIEDFEENPSSTPLPDIKSDPAYQKAFNQIQEEKKANNDFSYDDADSMVTNKESGTVYEDIDSEEDKNRLRVIENRLSDISKIEPSIDQSAEAMLNNDLTTLGPDGTLINNPGEDGSLADKAMWYGAKAVNSLAGNILSTISWDGLGIGDKKLKEEHVKLLNEKKDIMKPVAAKQLTQIDKMITNLEEKQKPHFRMSKEYKEYDSAISKLEQKQNDLNDFINDNIVSRNLWSRQNILDWSTLGISGIADAIGEAQIRVKQDNGEELSEGEEAILNAKVVEQEVEQNQYGQRFFHEITSGVNTSLQLLGFGKVGRPLGKIAKHAVRNVAKGVKGQVVTQTANVITQSAAHPFSYKYAFDKYAGDAYVTTTPEGQIEVVTGWRMYDAMHKENLLAIEDIEDQRAQAEASGDVEMVRHYSDLINDIKEAGSKMKEPVSGVDAGIYGITEVGKEITSELFGGQLLRWGTKGVRATKLGKYVSKSKLNRMSSAGKDAANRQWGTVPGTQLIGSNIEEMFEEVLVQLTPSYGTTTEEYFNQVSELATFDFYAKVAAQTILMQKSFQAYGTASKQVKIRSMKAPERAKRKATIQMYKDLGKRNITQDQFNEILMKSGQGDFSIQEYDNKVKELRNKNLYEEANAVESTKLHKQAVAAQKYGVLGEFKKALNSAKYNKNLEAHTLANITALQGEIDEMIDDTNLYINRDEVIGIKSRKRFAEKTIADLDSAINEADKVKIDEEFEVINKKHGFEGNTIDSYLNFLEDNTEKLNEGSIAHYLANNYDSFSEEMRRYLSLNAQLITNKTSLNQLDTQLKKVTSFDHQTKMENEQEYFKAINGINIKQYNRNMTSKQFTDEVINKVPNKVKKHISKERLEEINNATVKHLELEEIIQSLDTQIRDPDPNPDVETPDAEVIELDKKSASALNVVADVEVDRIAESFDTDNDIIIEEGDNFELLPDEGVTEVAKEWSTAFKSENNREATFEDFYNSLVEAADNNKDNFSKSVIQMMGESWEAGGLGKSNWSKLYDSNYTSVESITQKALLKVFATQTKDTTIDPEITNDKSEKEGIKKVNKFTGEEDLTFSLGKTLVTNTKSNYNALLKEEEEIVTEVDGKLVLLHVKTDTKETPILNETSVVDVKQLLHPDNNNPGDVLTTKITTEDDWGELSDKTDKQGRPIHKILVSVNDPISGISKDKKRHFIPFTDWVKKNQPKGMSIEEFKKTDKFKAKVPILYYDSAGNVVGTVADVEWYNAMNIGDANKQKKGDLVDIKNPSETHMASITEGKKNAFELRKNILDNNVKEVTIVSKDGSPWIKLPKAEKLKPLEQASPTSELVIYKGDRFVNLDGSPLAEDIEITNIESVLDTDDVDEEGNKKTVWSTFYLSPVNKTGQKRRFAAINVSRKNENNENQAMSEDIQTAKYILIAQHVLYSGKKYGEITPEYAENIRQQVKEATGGKKGLDISDFNTAANLVNSLIALTQKVNTVNKKGKKSITIKKHSAIQASKKFTFTNKKGKQQKGIFLDALVFGSNLTAVQNTNISPTMSHGLSIVKKQDDKKISFTVTKVAPTYKEFLQKRLTTNIVSYNMGTEESPAWTHSVQPIIEVEAVIDQTTLSNKDAVVEESTTARMTPEESKAYNDAMEMLAKANMLDPDEADELPALKQTDALKEALNVIPGLTIDQQHDIVNHILASFSQAHNDKTQSTIESDFKDKHKEFVKQHATLTAMQEANPNLQFQSLIDKLAITIESSNTVLKNFDTFIAKAKLKAIQEHLIPSTKELDDVYNNVNRENEESYEEELYEKDFYKTSNEVIHKDKIGGKLRRLFSTIPSNHNGFLGTPKYDGFNTMYNTVITLLTSPLPTDPSFDSMMEELEKHVEAYSWMKPLITKLRNSESDTKNGFVSNMYKYKAKAKFILFTRQRNSINAELWDSNANDIKRKIKESWNNNFKRSNITNESTLNTEKLKALYAQWESWGVNKSKQSDEVLREWLADFGIVLNDLTWKNMKAGKMISGKGISKYTVPFEKMFSEATQGNLFSHLAKFAKSHMNDKQGELDFINSPKSYHPHFDMGNILKSLINMEINNNSTFVNVSRRDGGKNVSEIIFPTFFLHNVRKLIKSSKGNKAYLNDLKELAFSSNSSTLDLLLNDPDFNDIFSYEEVGLESLSELGKKTNPFAKIDQLSSVGYMFHQRGMFQWMQTDAFNHNKHGFGMRIATVSTPTNSDKGRMMLLKTAVYNLFKNPTAFKSNNDGSFNFSDSVRELIYESLVVPELNRIIEHTATNIKEYDKGAGRFNMIPILNTIKNADDVTAIDFLSTNKNSEEFKEQFFKPIANYLENSIKKEADANVKLTENINANGKTDMFNSPAYLAQRKTDTVQEKRLLAEYDYIINTMIANMDTMQLIAGDPAMYYKSNGNSQSLKTAEQIEVSKDLGVNMGKRMALMIAPGNVGAQKTSDKYIQLFLKDSEEVAQNIEQIIGWHYGEKALTKQDRQQINALRNGELSKEDTDKLKFKYPKAAGFLTIESTDAQEYTTLKEHLDVLVSFGRITQEKANSIQEKSDNGTLSKHDPDIQLVLQPMKPVYTGDIIDKRQGVRRIMYIKSSSFPLIPALVNGTELQPLMDKMNALQKKHGYNVRASYQSANKVGALSEGIIDPFDSNSLASLDAVNDDASSPVNSLVLDRINFKIQQDVPFKSDMQHEDKVSMGTQIFKLLFGDGMTDLKGFELDGKTYNGQELKQELFKTFSEMVGIQQEKLMKELGLNANYKATNEIETAEKLQKLLIDEAIARGFSDNDMKALKLYYNKVGENEKVTSHFKLPLWFLGSSNKFESMLNAIINNRIFKQKLPGNSFVVGSEAGLQIREGIENLQKNKIVRIGDYKGGELKGTDVLMPSKFKFDGKLIDMFDVDDSGNYIYIKDMGTHFEINEEMFDPALLGDFTFRTPTSSHGSANNIRVVGFLPDTMGDLMITPKNFVAQMGQDFDVDKLTNYQLNHIVTSAGKIVELTEKSRDKYISESIALINQYREDIKAEKKFGDATNNFIASIFGENISSKQIIKEIENDINAIKSRINKDFDLKLAQNRFIKIHNSVYNNPAAQSRIHKVLSMDSAETQARGIDEVVNLGQKDLNLLSPTYQMDKMIAGSTGSLAIGIYAKGVTFNSLAQQTEETVRLMHQGTEGPMPTTITIGALHSNGSFGNLETRSANETFETKYDLTRRISEVLDEKVNTATDNEKAQVLGRVGITHIDAVAVDNLLSQLGIDLERKQITEKNYNSSNPFHKTKLHKGEQIYYTEYSIPYLLASQPIIKEYFTRLKNAKSIINNDSFGDVEDQIASELIGKNLDGTSIADAKDLTGDRMIQEIVTNDINTSAQKRALIIYTSLIKDAKKLKELQDVVDVSNLGKSMWESKEKIDNFNDLSNEIPFQNAHSLLGVFGDTGKLDIGNRKFTPTTNQGVMVGTAMSLAKNLFYTYFPYYNDHLNNVMTHIINSTNKKDSPELRITMFQEIKKYFTSNIKNNIFSNNAIEERKDLFIDKGDKHESLSTYTAKLFGNKSKEYEDGIKIISNNILLSSMSYERGEDGKPSLIKFDNTEIADVSDEHFHASFKELLISDSPLPNKNGKPYSTRLLAQDLVAYSYLGGGIVSQAIEFHKFIPLEYYDDLITPTNKTTTSRLQGYDTRITNWEDKEILKYFEEQFFQNNPDYAYRFFGDEAKKVKENKSNGTMVIDIPKMDYPKYVSVRNKTSRTNKRSKLKYNKWSLYRQIQDNNYEKIDVVGEFGMSEYDPSTNKLTSALDKTLPPADVTSKLAQNISNRLSTNSKSFSISPGQNAQTILENIKNADIAYNPALSSIADTILKLFPDKLNGITIKIINDPDSNFKGRHLDGKITINVAKPNIAETFIHEFVHSVTVNNMKPYYNTDWTPKGDVETPKEIQNLNILFSEYNKKVKEKYGDEYASFKNKYAKYKAELPIKPFTQRELSVFYATVNIKEFIAISLSNNADFIEEASQMSYKKSGMTISEKFVKVLNDLLNRISGVENNLAEQILNTSFETVQVLNQDLQQEVDSAEMESLKKMYDLETQDDFIDDVDNMSDPDNNNDVPFGELLPECI